MKNQKLAAIVFTDIVGYTKRMEADEEHTLELLARQREIIFPLVKEFDGEVIKEIGDGLLMMFQSANRAVRFAIAVQEKLIDDEITIRAGIHIGDVIFEGGDVFGSAVNIAARIEPLATPGGICISDDVRSQIRNQKDISTISIGEKELKGVNEAVEIFRVRFSGSGQEKERVPFIKDLWKRRVIQITAFYLALAFIIRLAVAFIVKEYMLSPYMVSLVWYLALALVPSTVLIAYFHGKKGVSRWSRPELIGLPVNAVLAALLLVFLFHGKDLGAATTIVRVQDETGKVIEKTVFKNEFRKKVLIFNIENNTGDPGLDFLQYGIPKLTEYDLSQDLLITPRNANNLLPKMADEGYENGTGLPITLMKRYAEKYHTNYFAFGTLKKQEKQLALDIKLYDTRLTRLVSEISVVDDSPFGLADKLSVEIKKSMGLPQSHIDGTVDLPVSEIFTSSEKALDYFTQAMRADAFKNWQEKVKFLDLAIKEDPGFAIAYLVASLAYLNTSDLSKARDYLQLVMDHYLHKLPDRNQFVARYIYYVLGQQPEKALTVAKMWTELFPDDLQAHETLAQRFAVRNMDREAIAEYKEILRLDPEQYEILSTLGDQYLRLGDNDSALVYYQQYADMLPQESKSYRNLGDYYIMNAQFELARKNYENALAVADASEKVSVMIRLGEVLINQGQFDPAHKQFLQVLDNAKSAGDSASAYGALEKLYLMKGQIKKSLSTFELKLDQYKAILSPKDFMVYRIFNIEPYLNAGEIDKAMNILDEIAAKLEPPLDNIVPFGYMTIYAETGETQKALDAISNGKKLIEDFGEEVLMAKIYHIQGKVHETLGEYQDAVDNYNKLLEIMATSYDVHGDIARCYRQLKEFKKAEKEILTSLKYRPFDPVCNYEAGLLYLDMGDREEGKTYLHKAVDIWKDADSDYEKANQAKEKLSSI